MAVASNKLLDTERAAVLRAIRNRIQQLTDRLETVGRHIRREFPAAQAEHDLLTSEMKLLESAVRKLWTGGNGHE